MMSRPSGESEANTVTGSTSAGSCIFLVKFLETIPPSCCFSSCFPDTSTYPSLVFTISSSGLKLCTLTHTFQGSPGKGGGFLPSAGTPNLAVAVGPRGTMPDLRVPGQAEESRGKAHSGQGAVKSSGKGSMPKPSSSRREESGESRKGSRRKRLG